MVNRTRIANLEDILDLLYEKLGEFKRELILNANTPTKFELKQRINGLLALHPQVHFYIYQA